MCNGHAQDAQVAVIEDGARVRIVRYDLPAGGRTGWHRHDLDYVIVPYDDCRLRVETASGPIDAEMRRDQPYFRSKGAEHDVINVMDRPISFLEIELKEAANPC